MWTMPETFHIEKKTRVDTTKSLIQTETIFLCSPYVRRKPKAEKNIWGSTGPSLQSTNPSLVNVSHSRPHITVFFLLVYLDSHFGILHLSIWVQSFPILIFCLVFTILVALINRPRGSCADVTRRHEGRETRHRAR